MDVTHDGQFLLFAIAFTVVLSVIAVVLARLIRGTKLHIARILSLGAFIVLLLSSPIVFNELLDYFNPTRGINRVFIHPGWVVTFAPATIALLAALFFGFRLWGSRQREA